MSNQKIVDILELTAKLIELHDGEESRAKIYLSATYNLDKYSGKLENLDFGQLVQLQGVGKLTAGKIIEIVSSGTTKELQELLQKTPDGLLEIFKIKGLGVKKIKTLWKEASIENIDQLEKACKEGNIAKIKGFGEKIQSSILESIGFVNEQKGKVRLDAALLINDLILKQFELSFTKFQVVGELARFSEVISCFQYAIIGSTRNLNKEIFKQNLKQSSPNRWLGYFENFEVPVEIFNVSESEFNSKTFTLIANETHLSKINEKGESFLQVIQANKNANEIEFYELFGSKYIVPEMRENHSSFEWIKNHTNDELIKYSDLKGILHNHSTYSDGKNTLEEMAVYCKELGFQYLGISDHSQSLSVASGLLPSKVIEQHKEIDILNQKLAPFKIFKGIESDILSDGSLDYEPEILKTFDFIVASVHQNLTMSLEYATERIIRAIENPYTTILGHPTGRVLLSRNAYPLDFKKVIDACAANNVIIELNASPYRLDLDWRHINYCLEKNVMISINPDAHSTSGYHDMEYGVKIARKGGLPANLTFNALDLGQISKYLSLKNQIS